MTPSLLRAALDRYYEAATARRKVEDHRAGVIAASIFNAMGVTSKHGGKKVWKPEHFFTTLKQKRVPVVEQSPDEMQEILMAAWGPKLLPPPREGDA